jgi:diketogulonate reductase-like aldo/keto reductase
MLPVTNDSTGNNCGGGAFDSGGQLIDTASAYGDAEIVLGKVIAAADLRSKLFLATKLERVDSTELKRSLARLKTSKLDLLQLHNVINPRQSLAQFNDWKTQGICRYTGITSTFHGDFAAVEAVLKREKPDFVQIDYSIDDRDVERRILPLAADVQAGVLTAQPLGRGQLFRVIRGQALPDWAKDFANSWAQFFLKYLLADQRSRRLFPAHPTRHIWPIIWAPCVDACLTPMSAKGWWLWWKAFKDSLALSTTGYEDYNRRSPKTGHRGVRDHWLGHPRPSSQRVRGSRDEAVANSPER